MKKASPATDSSAAGTGFDRLICKNFVLLNGHYSGSVGLELCKVYYNSILYDYNLTLRAVR